MKPDQLRRADRVDYARRLARRQGLALAGRGDGPFAVVDPRRGTTLAENLTAHGAQRALEARLMTMEQGA
jgi:RNase H-fold protein (predicted Holliday junction resolvase)